MRRHPALAHDWSPRREPPNVQLAEDCYVWSAEAFRRCRSELPTAVRVGHGSGLYWGTTFDLGPAGRVDIGHHCTVVSPVFSANAHVVVGDYVFLSFDVVIADSPAAVPPDAYPPAPAAGATAPRADPAVVVGDDAWIGMRAVLLPGAHLGRGVIVGAASVVDVAVPDYAVVAGAPARIVGWARPGGGGDSPSTTHGSDEDLAG